MSVIIPIPIDVVEEAQELPSLTYSLDFKRGRIMRTGSVDGIEAIRQFIKKALLTPRFRCLIYDNQYGSELKETIIAEDVTREFIEAEIPRLVEDALLVDSRVLSVYDFSFEFESDGVHIRFLASTVYGEIIIEEVL